LKKDIQKIIVLNKKEGETPLEALSLFRSTHKSFKDVPMTYAGRLDPMASGLLVILIGEE
jgi:tRNA U55 pseudouridine synthase TruB